MATTSFEIKQWLNEAKEQKATHMLVVCDTFDYEDYPVFVKSTDKVEEEIREYSKNMQRVMEVYNLSLDIDEQIKQRRSWNL